MASTQSNWPDLMAIQAEFSAVDALAQAFSTFVMGIPSSQFADSATWPRIQCWNWNPQAELENQAASMSSRLSPQSLSTSSRASPVNALMPFSRYLPNLIM